MSDKSSRTLRPQISLIVSDDNSSRQSMCVLYQYLNGQKSKYQRLPDTKYCYILVPRAHDPFGLRQG